jgi:cell division septum initiation protein DivIVA
MATARYVSPDIPGFDASAYLAANPDIAEGWGKQSTDKSFAQKFPTATDYASWHYLNYGQAEIAAGKRDPLGAQGKGPETTEQAQTSTTDLTTNLTNTANNVITDVKKTVDDATGKITDTANNVVTTVKDTTTDVSKLLGDQTTAFTNLVNQFGTDFNNAQSSLLEKMQSAAADQVAAIQKAIKDATNQTGQAQKKPNYAQALAKNKELNSGGLSATMLTGPTGVTASALPLATTSIIGK